MLIIISLVFLWSYWPIFSELVQEWIHVPDYSHGFLVLPLAAGYLWMTRDRFTGIGRSICWGGLSLMLIASALRVTGAYFYLDALHGWSIPVWIGGAVWMFFGWSTFCWSLPAVAFLIFMVPLPYTVEIMMARPLQAVSTQISLFVLQCLGQPAVASGTTIVLGTHTLEIERACSGLRVFFGMTAMAYAFMILFKRPWWTKLMLVVSIVPITLLANSVRIVGTGMLHQLGSTEAAKWIGHDLAGLIMIPLAVAFFALTLTYLDKLFPPKTVDIRNLVRQQMDERQSAG